MFGVSTRNSFAETLTQVQGFLKKDLDQVNSLILNKLSLRVPLINGMAGYLIQAGGKRLRPLLTLLSARLLGYQGQRHIKIAACIEFIHTATLLHDDVVDRSTQRRGRPSANAIWGDQSSILVGDFLFCRAFELVTEDGSLDVLRVLSRTATAIAEGEIMQLGTVGNLDLVEKQYFQIIEAKTALLFESSCHVGALIANASQRDCELLKEYGYNFGIVFQMIDDLLDYGLHKTNPGKDLGRDFQEKNMTLPLILLCEQVTAAEKDRIIEMFSVRSSDEESFSFLRKMMKKYRIDKEILNRSDPYLARALGCLEGLPESAEKDFLRGFVSYVDNRSI
ncbi:MAG: polyprenyl synthetase family protein [Alphaproteobacteria bacterium]